jgi:hypothetical protein
MIKIKPFKKSSIIHHYIFILLLAPFLFTYVSCSKTDTKPKVSFINFALSGSLLNGDFEIKKTDMVNDLDKATGLLLPATESASETAIINFQDHDQGLSVNLVFPAEKKLFEMLFNDIYYISVSHAGSNTNLASKTVSMNVSEFKKTGIAFISKISATGNFNVIMVYVDAATDQEYPHTITGRFEFFN